MIGNVFLKNIRQDSSQGWGTWIAFNRPSVQKVQRRGGQVMSESDTLLKTTQMARALGVSISTIKRWVDSGALRASRTVGKHRLIRLDEAVRFAKAQGLPHADLESLPGAGAGAMSLD